jgi:hypothetical protein
MMRKVLETVTAILTIALVATLATAQTDKPSAAPGSYTASYKAQTQPPADCNGGPCEEQQPHIVVTLPAPAPEKWPIHDRISWAAYLVLAILGYVGIMLALSTLKKIERQTAAAETAAKASAESAQIALLHARSLIAAERPWIMISVEPTGQNHIRARRHCFCSRRGASARSAHVQACRHKYSVRSHDPAARRICRDQNHQARRRERVVRI